MLGLYVSDHPLMGAEPALRRHVECSIAELADLDDGSMRNVAGVVTALQRKYTKRGDLMATFVLEDLAAAIEVMVFPKTMLQYGELLDADAIVVLKARIDGREDTPKLMAMEITRPEINIDGGPPADAARQGAPCSPTTRVEKLRELLRSHPGREPGVRARRRAREGDGAPPRRRVPLRRAQRPLRRAPRPLRRRLHRVMHAPEPASLRGDNRPVFDAGSQRLCDLLRSPDANWDPGGDGSGGERARGPARGLGTRSAVRVEGGRQGQAERRRPDREVGRPGRGPCTRATTPGRATRRSSSSRSTPTRPSRPCTSTRSGCRGRSSCRWPTTW